MKVKIKDIIGRATEYSVAEYVKARIDDGSHEGQLETVERASDNAADVLARLIETLADKGTLEPSEVETIVEGYARGDMTVAE